MGSGRSLLAWLALAVVLLAPLAADAKRRGRVRLASSPSGAAVYLAGADEALGRTPLSTRLPVGRHELRFELEGHEPTTVRIRVRRRGVARARAVLEPMPRTGVVRLDAPPGELDGAAVLVDGEPVDPSGAELELDAGSHSIEIEKTGFQPAEIVVAVAAGETIDLPVTLEPLPAEQAEAADLDQAVAAAVSADAEVEEDAAVSAETAPKDDDFFAQSKVIWMVLEDYGPAQTFDGTYAISVFLQRFDYGRQLSEYVAVDAALPIEAAVWNSENELFALLGMDSVIDTAPQGLPLQWDLPTSGGEQRFQARVRFDRLNVRLGTDEAAVTVGRQSFSLSPGMVFTPLDVLTPLPVAVPDREFRPGIDAVSAEAELGAGVSALATYALATSWDENQGDVFLPDNARLVGAARYQRNGQQAIGMAALIHGMPMVGAGWARSPAPLGVYGEGAIFFEDTALGTKSWFPVANLGGVYSTPKLTVGVEGIYSGFSVTDPADYPLVLSHPRVQSEQIPFVLNRFNTAAYGFAALHPRVFLGGVLLWTPTDGSGRVRPNVTVMAGPSTRIDVAVSVPWGPRNQMMFVPAAEQSLSPIAFVLNASHTY